MHVARQRAGSPASTIGPALEANTGTRLTRREILPEGGGAESTQPPSYQTSHRTHKDCCEGEKFGIHPVYIPLFYSEGASKSALLDIHSYSSS